jgi:GT2 family glycosyltransferase
LGEGLPKQARTGIIGFHLRNADGSQQLSTGPFPTFGGTLARLLLPRHRRKYRSVRAAGPCRVPWVTGCCLLVRRACWEDVRGLDESFFLYYEDVDLCRRAGERGWSVGYEPRLPVVHHNPLHSRPVPAALRLVLRHSLLTYAAKHWPAWQARLLGRIVQLESAVRRLWAWWRGDHHDANLERELHLLVQDCLRGRRDSARARLDRVVHRKDLRMGV